MTPAALRAALGQDGLRVRGAFHPGPADGVPDRTDGRAVGTLVLVGHAGPAMWRVFRGSPEARQGPDPLDRWSRRVIGAAAETFGATALYPFGGPPWLPFLIWAKRAEPVFDSPLGLVIHPDFGLWHGYRGALAFAEVLPLPVQPPRFHPCAACTGRPCLSACPVGAFAPAGYDSAACQSHLARPEGVDCLGHGCRARRACPVGRAWTYQLDQAGFHMRAFVAVGTEGWTKKPNG